MTLIWICPGMPRHFCHGKRSSQICGWSKAFSTPDQYTLTGLRQCALNDPCLRQSPDLTALECTPEPQNPTNPRPRTPSLRRCGRCATTIPRPSTSRSSAESEWASPTGRCSPAITCHRCAISPASWACRPTRSVAPMPIYRAKASSPDGPAVAYGNVYIADNGGLIANVSQRWRPAEGNRCWRRACCLAFGPAGIATKTMNLGL